MLGDVTLINYEWPRCSLRCIDFKGHGSANAFFFFMGCFIPTSHYFTSILNQDILGVGPIHVDYRTHMHESYTLYVLV